jgi:hypothetical protein
MSTTSPNFGLVIATTSDQVNVVTQIAGNFSTLDSVIGIAHTGTGQLKSGLALMNPTLQSPTLSGTLSGGTIAATTGRFNTITATGGMITANTFAIGTYNLPTTIGADATILTVVTSNAVWVANAPGTGANAGLSNLAAVAINTSLNTFTAGFVTVNRVVATSGNLIGLSTAIATIGTFGTLAVTGTLTAAAANFTGGSITPAAFSIGTYSYPATVGADKQVLTVTTGNAQWLTSPPYAMDFVAGGAIAATSRLDIPLTLSTGAMYMFTFVGTATGIGNLAPSMQIDSASGAASYLYHNLATMNTSDGIYFSTGGAATVAAAGGYYVHGRVYENAGRVHLEFNSSIFAYGVGSSFTGQSSLFYIYTAGAATGMSFVDSTGGNHLAGSYRIYKMRTS